VLRVGVLLSGSGTNLQAIIDRVRARTLSVELALAISNRAAAKGLERAQAAGVPTRIIDHRTFSDRAAFDAALVAALERARVELVVLAGFDRLVTTTLLSAFPQRVINIHPALLPAFPGMHAQRQAADFGVKLAGATVHFVDEHVDHGPIIVQGAVPVRADDDEGTLAQRILGVEHEIYPLAIQLFADGRLSIVGRRVLVSGPRPSAPAALIAY
jgi:phosphoribosylglycinamide formyltransferase 1